MSLAVGAVMRGTAARLSALMRTTAARLSALYLLLFGVCAIGLVVSMTSVSVRILVAQTQETINEESMSMVRAYERGGLFCYLKPTRDAEIQLGFYKGAQLDDPAGLLEGRGKRRRYVRVALDGALDEAALLALIEGAAALEAAA